MSKLKDLGRGRVCERHKTYIKECPHCNMECRLEEHSPDQKGIKVIVPVYRKRIVIKSKDYNTKNTVDKN